MVESTVRTVKTLLAEESVNPVSRDFAVVSQFGAKSRVNPTLL
jgi:hypothetical protein